MDPITLAMFGVLAILVFFTWRSSRKRKQQAEEQRESLVPGVEIMTNYGLYGTVVSIDRVVNIAEVEVAPGTIVRIHPGSIAKTVTEQDADAPRSVEEAMARANAEAEERELELNKDSAIPLGEPEFGERTEEPTKPVRRSAKKSAE